MSIAIENTNIVELVSTIDATASATVKVIIENGHVKHIKIGYSTGAAPFLWIKHDNRIDALIELRDQINEVIDEYRKRRW